MTNLDPTVAKNTAINITDEKIITNSIIEDITTSLLEKPKILKTKFTENYSAKININNNKF